MFFGHDSPKFDFPQPRHIGDLTYMDLLQGYIDVNNLLSSFWVEFDVNQSQFILNGHLIFGGILVVVASWLGFRAAENFDRWQLATKTIKPSLEATDAPIITVVTGCRGCIFGNVERALALIFLFTGLDQIFFSGGLLTYFIGLSIQSQ